MFEGTFGGRVSPSLQFKVCCPDCAIPTKCPTCKRGIEAKNHHKSEGVLMRLTVKYKCGTAVVYKREGNSFSPEWKPSCQ